MSTRDKRLLLIVGGIIIFLVCYSFIYLPKSEASRLAELDNNDLTTELTVLQTYAGTNRLASENETLTASNAAIFAKFPSSVTKADALKLINDLEKKSGLVFTSVSIGEAVDITVTKPTDLSAAELAFKADAAAADKQNLYDAGVVSDGSVTVDGNAGLSSRDTNTTGLSLYRLPVTVAFRGSYDSLKTLVADIPSNDVKMSLSDFEFDADENVITGSATINIYYITGNDREEEKTETGSVTTGKSDIFAK